MISRKDITLTKEDVSELLNAFGGNDDDSCGNKEATPTLSDEEIKLEILRIKCGDFILGDLRLGDKQGLEEIFQWVKGE